MEHVSALMDGELTESQMNQQLAHLREYPDLLECWDTFHLIGDVLRGDGTQGADIDGCRY